MNCGNKWLAPKEKMTDVNIATEMLQDAFLDKYDMAMLISGDSDLIPPIRAIHNNFKKKKGFRGLSARKIQFCHFHRVEREYDHRKKELEIFSI